MAYGVHPRLDAPECEEPADPATSLWSRVLVRRPLVTFDSKAFMRAVNVALLLDHCSEVLVLWDKRLNMEWTAAP